MVGESTNTASRGSGAFLWSPVTGLGLLGVNEQLRNGDEWGKRKGDISCFFGWVAGGGDGGVC